VLLLDGEEHARQRRLLIPPLHGERLARHTAAMQEVTLARAARWPLGRPFALHPELQRVTLEIILRTVFGLERGAEAGALGDAFADLARIGNSWMLLVPKAQINLGPRSPWGRVVAIRRRADAALYAEIARRRAAGSAGRDDALSMLLEARDEAGVPMTDEELRDELVTLLLAGHETTATALAWAIELLWSHPAVLARAEREVVGVLRGAPIEPAHVAELVYLDAVVKEVLRLYPVLPNVSRRLREALAVPGHELPARTYVAPCAYLTQRRPDLYAEAERFQPERWLDRKVDPYRYYPFGGGSRRCLGMTFAIHEMKVVLATLLASARLRLAGRGPTAITRRGITLAPAGGARVVVEARPR
jgi:cytochrome P450